MHQLTRVPGASVLPRVTCMAAATLRRGIWNEQRGSTSGWHGSLLHIMCVNPILPLAFA